MATKGADELEWASPEGQFEDSYWVDVITSVTTTVFTGFDGEE